jgi:hypothetical protein
MNQYLARYPPESARPAWGGASGVGAPVFAAASIRAARSSGTEKYRVWFLAERPSVWEEVMGETFEWKASLGFSLANTENFVKNQSVGHGTKGRFFRLCQANLTEYNI